MTNGTLGAGDRLPVLMALNRSVFTPLDVAEVLRAVSTAVRETTDAAVVALWTADDEPPVEGVVSEVAQNRQPVHTPTLHAVPSTPPARRWIRSSRT